MNYKDCYLIVENSSSPLTPIINNVSENFGKQPSSNSSHYILEGMFTNLNEVKNRNGRIYEKEMFMPFYEKCKLKAESGSFIGECDHPKRFETQFKTASHIIEKLWYDESKKAVMGRIRILNGHPIGEMVKSLIDNGVQINVSSRSAGTIGQDGKVQLKEVFTWDLVTVPGFEGTNMSRVQESLSSKGINPNILENHLPASGGFINLSENFGFSNSIEIYDINSVNNSTYVGENLDNNILNMNEENLTKKDLKKLLEYVNHNFKSIENKFKNKDLYSNDSKSQDLELQLEYLKAYVSKFSDKVNDFFEHHEYTTKILSDLVEYQDYQTKDTERIASYADYLGSNLKEAINYSEYLAEKLGVSNAYSQYMANVMENVIEHSDYLSEHLNNSIGYTEVSNINTANEMKKIKAYADYLGENIQDVSYMNQGTSPKEAKKDDVSFVNNLGVNNYEDLGNKIDSLIENVSINRKEEKNKYNFVNRLPYEKRKEFNMLSEEKKQNLEEAFKQYGNKPLLEFEINDIWNQVLSVNESNEPLWLEKAPKKYRKIWETLSDQTKQAISIQANSRILNTQYEIDNFWFTRTLNQGKMIKESQKDLNLQKLFNLDSTNPISESEENITTKAQKLYGFSDEELDRELGIINN